MSRHRAWRAQILHFTDDPGLQLTPAAGSMGYWHDGLVLVREGKILALGDATQLLGKLPPDTLLEQQPHALLMPGFIDAHSHVAQIDAIASYGSQLLDWLNQYAFPTETSWADSQHASRVSEAFLDELLRNGTTSAAVFCTSHPAAVDAFFSAAAARNLRMIAGKVMMDLHAPAVLLDTAQSSYHDSKALIRRWHGKQRLSYAVTPRFAPTSSAQQLQLAGQLLQEYPDLYLQTHWAENHAEIAWAGGLFAEYDSYLGLYQGFGLVGSRSLLAHGIHITDHDRQQVASAGASVIHCPTSNSFLGSGLFDYRAAYEAGVAIGLGTDVGAGSSFSMLATMAEAYKVAQLQGHALTAWQAFYRATLGNARALSLDACIGHLSVGAEADFILLDEGATPLMARKWHLSNTLHERLFNLMILGDDRAIQRTYVAGECVHDRDLRSALNHPEQP